MKSFTHQFSLNEAEFLEKALKQKVRLQEANGIAHLPPFFDIGHRVGFFYGTGPNDHSIGVIVAEDMRKVTIKTDSGRVHEVSPFLLFRL